MNDRSLSISASRTISVVLALIGTALILANWFFEHDKVAFMSLPCLTLSAVMQVRHYFCQAASVEQNAFQLGRDSVTAIRR